MNNKHLNYLLNKFILLKSLCFFCLTLSLKAKLSKKNIGFSKITEKIMRAIDVSQYVISFCAAKGDLITNKKLQKLLYYIEAWQLVHQGSLIDEQFEAWVHGPVIPYVYGEYKKFGYQDIVLDFGAHPKTYNEQKGSEIGLVENRRELTNEVIYKYGGFSSFQLEMLSHSELPWLKARGGLGPAEQCNANIDKALMKEYYSSLL